MAQRSFRLINSFLSVIIIAFDIELLSTGLPLGLPAILLFLVGILSIPFKIGLYCGAFGLLADMAGGREDFCTKKDFLSNMKRFTPLYALMSAGVVGAHFLYSLARPDQPVQLPVFQAVCDGLFLFFFASLVVRSKYPQVIAGQRRPLPVADLAAMIAIYSCYVGLVILAFQEQAAVGLWGRLIFLVAKYFQFLLYAAFVFYRLKDVKQVEPQAEQKELILVFPIGGSFGWQVTAGFLFSLYPPIFLVLKALTPASYRIREFNRRIWQDRYARGGALVAVTCQTVNCAEAYRIARDFRKAGSQVVMGGPHVSCFPEEALEFSDSVIVGAAEGVWDEVVRDFEHHSLKRVYEGTCPEDKFEQVDQYLLTCPPEQLKHFLETTRGCRFSCDFCALSAFWGKSLVRRRPETVAALVSRVREKSKVINFIDGNLFADPDHMVAVLNAIAPLDIQWYAQMSIDVAAQQSMLDLMKKSGCRGILVGYEIAGDSPSQREGKFAMASRYLELSRKVRAMGITIKAHFMSGFEEEKWPDLFRLWSFAFRLFPNNIEHSFLQPLPGTAVFRKLVENDRIRNLNWRFYSASSVVYDHPRMSSRLLAKIMPAFSTLLFFTCSKNGIMVLAGSVLAVWLFSSGAAILFTIVMAAWPLG